MTTHTRGRTLRRRAAWAVPVLTIAAVGAATLLSTTAAGSPHPRLPARTPAQLLAAVQTSATTALSGTIVETARLGLPALPGADSSASLSWQSLITGSHTAQVWTAGPDKLRIALKGSLAESDVVRNGRDLWTYSSQANQASHTVLAPDTAAPGTATPDARSYTPAQVAQRALSAITPTTHVSVDRTRMVAGRKAYTLVLTPRDTASTISRVTIALDSVHFVPLQVQVFGSGRTPAFETGFTTNLSFATPKASVFNFHVPAGATVVTDPLEVGRGQDHTPSSASPEAAAATSGVKVIGTGWTAVAALPHGLPAGATGGLLDRLTTPAGSSGDRILRTALVNALFLKDGRVFLGAVTPARLERVAAATPR